MANPTSSWRKIKQEIAGFERVVVACSGGVDSVFLLDFVNNSMSNQQVAVAYFDHDLGNGDVEFVRDLADKYKMQFFTARGIDIQTADSVEAEARKQRYAFLSSVKDEFGAAKILTGHHLNDNVETVLLRLLRGYDHSSLGMPRDNGLVFRPFLDVPKKTIVDQAKKRGLTWTEDQSNLSSDFERNYLRNEIIPLLMTKRNLERTVVKGLGR